MVPASVFGVDHAPTSGMAFTTEAYTLSPGPPIPVPISGSIERVPKQLGSALGSASGAVLETPLALTVSDNVLTSHDCSCQLLVI